MLPNLPNDGLQFAIFFKAGFRNLEKPELSGDSVDQFLQNTFYQLGKIRANIEDKDMGRLITSLSNLDVN